jgi:hypothetical protein
MNKYKWFDKREQVWRLATKPKLLKSPPGYEGFTFYLHKEAIDGLWRVTESESGWACNTSPQRLRKDALANFSWCLTAATPKTLRLRIEGAKDGEHTKNLSPKTISREYAKFKAARGAV